MPVERAKTRAGWLRLAAVLGTALALTACESGDNTTATTPPAPPPPPARVAFYGGFNPYVQLPVVVTVDGVQVGTITGVYPGTPPGNCSADFTAQTTIAKDGRSHDWNARSANQLAFSGTVAAYA